MEDFQLHNEWYDNLDDILCDIKFTKKSSKGSIGEVASVFDIEATSFYNNDEKVATMYAWVFGINGKCIRGRTWDEFIQVCNRLQAYYELTQYKRLVVYVHNLSYEFQWFKDRFKWIKNFSLEARKPIYAICEQGIEFRCSYLLSGYNLDNVGKNLLKYKVEKKVGDLDYYTLRHSKTPLTDKEWGYILNDGLVVMAYIQEEIERLGSIRKLPLTKTGYVRNYCKELCLAKSQLWRTKAYREALVLDSETYLQMKRTYTGGFTHANARYVGKKMTNVSSYDFTSSYPSVMFYLYPMSSPIKYEIKSKKDFYDHLKSYACMFEARFTNLTSKVNFEHYISISRCLKLKNYISDNGRVVEADEVIASLTELDFDIISKMYEWEHLDIYNFYFFYRSYLPLPIINATLQLYEDKTKLKGVPEREVDYMVSKGMLNSLYGMCVTDPCKDVNIYSNNDGWITEEHNLDELLEKYNKSFGRFLYYAWGVWITAYARHNLFTGILECGEDYLYADTDSVKIINREKHLKYFEEYNINVQNKIRRCLDHYMIPYERVAPKTIKGTPKPLGFWDYEGTYKNFKTLGAKRYLYEDEKGEMHITIAGVGKEKGVKYLKYKYKTNERIFKNFTDKLNFPATYIIKEKGKDDVEELGCGKLCHTYIDVHLTGELIDYLGNKATYDELSSVHLEATGYDLSLEASFINYLLEIQDNSFMED